MSSVNDGKKRITSYLKMENLSLSGTRNVLIIACFLTFFGSASIFVYYPRGDLIWTAFHASLVVVVVGFPILIYSAKRYLKLRRLLIKTELEAKKKMYEGLPKETGAANVLLKIEGKTAARVVGWEDGKNRFHQPLENIYSEVEVPESAIAVSIVVFDEKGKPQANINEKKSKLNQYYIVP